MNLTTLRAALPLALSKLNPRLMIHSPVMFTVLIGSILCTAVSIQQLILGSSTAVFSVSVTVWLWLTVLFGNLAESIAEGRGRAQADSLRSARTSVMARRRSSALVPAGQFADTQQRYSEEMVPGTDLVVGDVVIVVAGELIPSDGDVIEGLASVDESAITGESAPVIRESGGDRSSVTGGTMVLSDRIVVRITAASGKTFLDRMISLVEGATRQKTPNEIALNVLLASLTIVFVMAIMTLAPMAAFADALPSPVVLVALVVCLIPTTIGALVPAIGIAGMDRLIQRNVLATSGRAVETAGDVTTLLLDKTGTITYGNRRAVAFIAARGVSTNQLIETARLSSLADETPEGRSIVELADGATEEATEGLDSGALGATQALSADVEVIEFSATTRMSGLNLPVGHLANPGSTVREVRKGAGSAVERDVSERGGSLPAEIHQAVENISGTGGTPLLVASYDGERAQILGVIHLADVVKPGMK